MSSNIDTTPPPSNTEIGYVVPDWNTFGQDTNAETWDVDTYEHVPALKWPNSIKIYDRMRNDPQIDALIRGMTLPIRRFRWYIDPDGAKKEITRQVAEDLGLPVQGEFNKKARQRRSRFNHDEHLRNAMLSLIYGHMFFEQVGDIEASTRGRLLWRLKKLGPRMPHSIDGIRIDRDGGLEWIRQSGELTAPQIPIDRLVVFVLEKEGANWFGRSLLRGAYQPWLLKDRLLRVDAIRHERNGMGVPIVELPERATDTQRKEGAALANQYRAGLASGGALPFGMKLHLVGVDGQVSDVLASIRYHDEAMARLMLQMFTQLGAAAQYGSKALGDTFVDFFAKSQDAVADWYAEVMNFYMISDWMDWNYGPDEKPPRLAFQRDEDPELSAHEIAQLVGQRVLTVDDELEGYLRDRYGLPPLGPNGRPKPQAFGLPAPSSDGQNPPPPGEENTNVTQPDPTNMS